ncbi:unnamed protein product [Allacma fusca]|uniref:Uncharacterized protein n=1 Tax=Allacma fusca TaxID=39272 RepID=A0A8J2J5H8_9HEXA|nr:unnamed protein product [Allacma fusca]
MFENADKDFGKFCRLAEIFQAIPYKWDRKSKCLTTKLVSRDTWEIPNITITSIFVIFFTACCIFIVNLVVNTGDIAFTLKELITLNLNLKAKFLRKDQETISKLEFQTSFLIQFMTPSVFTISFGFVFIFFLDPYNPRYVLMNFMDRNIESWNKTQWLCAFFIFTLEFYTYVNGMIVCYFHWFLCLIYCNRTKFWLQQITSKTNSSWLGFDTKGDIRRPHTSAQVFRSLQILNTCFNQGMRKIVMNGLFLFNFLSQSVCSYSVIKFHQDLPILLLTGMVSTTLTWCIVEFLTYPLMAVLYTLSSTFIKSTDFLGGDNYNNLILECQRLSMSKLDVKIRKSMRPLALNAGDFYRVKEETPLTVLAIVSSLTFNLLILT